jgi:microcystin degradation protein MlrC
LEVHVVVLRIRGKDTMRVAIAEIVQETDSFNPVRSGLPEFERYGLYEGGEILEKAPGVGMLGAFLDLAQDELEGMELVPIIRAWAGACGTLTAETLDYFEKRIVDGLQAALPLDGFYFALHGAAAAESDDDLEGHLLEAARRVLGPDVPIVSPMDHHGNVTKRTVDNSDIIVGHTTQPHDPYGTGQIAARLFHRQLKGEISPTVAWHKIPMITPQDQFLTSGGPMKELFDLAREMESRPGVLTASPFPMQPWLDVKEGGWACLVYTDDDPELAQTLADQLSEKAWEMREQFWKSERLAADEAVKQAEEAESGLVILSDTGDSVYGGAPGDSTCILRALVEGDVSEPALVPLLDPIALDQAAEAGVGSRVKLTVGAKFDSVFHQPIEISGVVAAVSEGLVVNLDRYGMAEIGRTALIEIGNVKLVLLADAGFAINQPILYTHLGLDVSEAKMVVVKTASNFQFFERWRKKLIRVDSPGMTQSDLTAFTWEHLPRPIHPLDDLKEWHPFS